MDSLTNPLLNLYGEKGIIFIKTKSSPGAILEDPSHGTLLLKAMMEYLNLKIYFVFSLVLIINGPKEKTVN